tara:strand:- start:10679 stop:11740 length:1062 start_codon:yes stop_codon:yes gene_type:complete
MAGEIQLNSVTALTESSGSIVLNNVNSATNRTNLGLAIGTNVQSFDADTTKNDVANTFTANQIISITDNTNAALRVTQLGTGDALVVEDSASADSTPFVVDATGKVGVGTSSPDSKIHSVSSTTGANSVNFQNTDSGGYGAKFVGGGGASNLYIVDFRDYSGSSKVRLDGNGALLIGIASATVGDNGVSLVGDGTNHFYAGGTNTLKVGRGGSNGDVIVFNRSGTTVGSISVTTSATAFNTSSDYRLKENITDITDGITRVKQLNPTRFNFIVDSDKTVDGFIAHQVSEVVPEAITGEKDEVDDDGNPKYQGIDQSKLVPLLTAALQESIVLIESQQSQIQNLAARIEALETT